MASKRRFPDSADEGPKPKHCTPRIDDDVTTERANDIKSVENSEDVPEFVTSCQSVIVDDVVEVKDEPEEVICPQSTNVDRIVDLKDEPEEVKCEPMDRNEPEWDILGDEKLVICELPAEIDEVDPLRPLNSDAEERGEPKDTVKTENEEDFGENSTPNKWLEARDDSARLGSATTSHKVPFTEQTPFKDTKIKAPDRRKPSDLKEFLSWVPRKSEICRSKSPQAPTKPLDDPPMRSPRRPQGPKSKGPRHQEEDSLFVPQLKDLLNTSFRNENPTHESSEDLFEHQSDFAETEFEKEAHQPSSKIPTQEDKPEDSPSSINIQLLVEDHFRLYEKTKEHVNSIIRFGRPTPLMGIPRDPDHGYWVTAKDYQLIPWLTGLKSLQKYYCWPCLLFTKEKWTVPGGMKQPEFWATIKDHNQKLLHRVAYENLKLRECELSDSKNQNPIPKIVKANRDFLELLIRILCSKKSKLHNTDSNFDGYEELMKIAISHKPELNQPFGTPLKENGLMDFVSRHASRLLSSIASQISASISEEIRESQYVSVVYEDIVSIVDRSSQVAVILRLLTKGGEVCERFVKLEKIGSSRNAYDILEMHMAVIEELGIKEKLVGFTFSGTVVAPKSMQAFINMVSKNSPKAKFFHHPDHNLKELLLQSLSHIVECQRFLEVISDLVTFLTTNSGAIPTLVTFIKQHVANPRHLEDPRSFTTDIISTVRVYYPLIIEFFGKVSEKFWNDEVAKQAPIFMKFLQESSNRFLLAVIATILETVDDLSDAMEKDYDAAEWTRQAQKALGKIKELYKTGPNYYVFLAFKIQKSNKDKDIDAEIQESFRETFKKILETSFICVFERAKKSRTFYVNSAHTKPSDIIRAEENWNRYGLQFKSSIEFQYQMNYNKAIGVYFRNKSIPQIAKTTAHMEMSNLTPPNLKSPKFLVWKDFIRFCAMSISPVKSTTSAPSTVLKLKYYLKDKQEPNATEVLMFLEKGILRSLLKNAEFIEEVITQYAKKNNEHNFLYDSPVECKLEIGV